jgi:superfamily II DNA helicase RecQ
MKPDGEFEKLLMNPLFASRIISIVIGGAHCLTDWGEFHPEYKRLGRLRYVLPGAIPFLVTSPALTKSDLNDVIHLFHVHMDRTLVVRRSSDRPNIKIGVKKITHPLNSFADLAFLIPAGFNVGDPPPPKFLVFFDDVDESIEATRFLWRCLPHELRLKIKWYIPDMSATFKKTELENLLSGETWGLCTTMSFGMVRTF